MPSKQPGTWLSLFNVFGGLLLLAFNLGLSWVTYAVCASGTPEEDFGLLLIKTVLVLTNLAGGLSWLHGLMTGQATCTKWLVVVIPVAYTLLFAGMVIAVLGMAVAS